MSALQPAVIDRNLYILNRAPPLPAAMARWNTGPSDVNRTASAAMANIGSKVRGRARVILNGQKLTVSFPRRAHNPILRAMPWHQLPQSLSWLNGIGLELKFK
jgi:hypothetical protein